MPFGLVNATSVFQSCINELIKKLPSGEAMAYLDDVIIPSQTIEEGLELLRRFLIVVKDSGLTLRLDKCVFLSERVKFLGHKVSLNSIEPGDDKVAAIRDYPAPRNAQEVRRFLGLTGFFRKCVRDYARIAHPLTAQNNQQSTIRLGSRTSDGFRRSQKPSLCITDSLPIRRETGSRSAH